MKQHLNFFFFFFFSAFLADVEESSDEYLPSSESSSSEDTATTSSKRRNILKIKCFRVGQDVMPDVLSTPLVPYSETDGSESSDSACENQAVQFPAVLTTQNLTPKEKQKVYLPRDNTSRKRKRNPQCWKKNKAAILREKGEAYLSCSGKEIQKKTPTLGMLCNNKCPFHCNDKFNRHQREHIFFDFYKLDTNAKNAYLYNCISIMPVQRQRTGAKTHKTSSFTYLVKNERENVRVCKTALAALFRVGRGKIDHIQKSIKAGYSVPPPDRRGKHTNRPHKIAAQVSEYIESHIRSFPCEESHYSRNKNIHKKYLSPLLSIKKMYELYLAEVNNDGKPDNFKVAECTYRHIFSSKFNLSFGHPRSDTCSTCEMGQVNENHAASYREAFDLQKFDRESSKLRRDVAYLTVDLQQTMPLPKLSVSKAFYLRQMWFYNLGVHVITHSKDYAQFFTWTENVACRGSNEVASSLLTLIEFDDSLRSIDHLIIWSDSCSGQNKNATMLFLYQYLILKGYFKVIEHKFPEVGHSYLDSDRDFGRIEINLRKHETIFLPDQYRDIIQNSGRNNHVTDMTSHFRNFKDLPKKLKLINRKKNIVNEKVAFRDEVKWIRVEEFGSYLYKDCYDPYTPFKKVNLLKQNRGATNPVQIEEVDLERTTETGASLTSEKIQNLQQQLPYIKNEYKYFYESVIQTENEKNLLP